MNGYLYYFWNVVQSLYYFYQDLKNFNKSLSANGFHFTWYCVSTKSTSSGKVIKVSNINIYGSASNCFIFNRDSINIFIIYSYDFQIHLSMMESNVNVLYEHLFILSIWIEIAVYLS
jgi:hypothetical protein